jgi:transcriptional regulator with XRE-family HTH domain
VGDGGELADYEGPLLVAAGTPGNRRFGALVKSLRERSGLSPQQLAEQAGVHVSFIRGIERGAQAPSVATAHPLLACMREQDRIQWMYSGPYDLLVRDAETGRDVAFEFKAKVKGQNRRTIADLPGVAASLSVVAEVLERNKVDPAPMTAALSVLAQALERRNVDAAAPGLLSVAEAMARIVPSVAETAEPDADVVRTAGDGEVAWDTPADEAAFGRVVRLLAAADEEMLARVESLLRDEV